MIDDPTTTAAKAKPREWIIDVCKICDRVARWPFCEHRGQYNWFDTVVVREVIRG